MEHQDAQRANSLPDGEPLDDAGAVDALLRAVAGRERERLMEPDSTWIRVADGALSAEEARAALEGSASPQELEGLAAIGSPLDDARREALQARWLAAMGDGPSAAKQVEELRRTPRARWRARALWGAFAAAAAVVVMLRVQNLSRPGEPSEALSAALESGVRLGLEGGAKPNRDGRPEVGDPHVLHADQRFTFTIQPRVSTSADYQVRLFARREGASDGVVLACPRWTLHGEHGVQRCAFDEASALGLGPGTWEVFAVFGAEERLPNTIAGALDSSGALRTSGAGWRLAEGPLRIEYRRP